MAQYIKKLVKPCKHHDLIDCDANCYSCTGCAWEPKEDKTRRVRIANGDGLKKRDGLLRLCLGRKTAYRAPSMHADADIVTAMFHAGKSIVETARVIGCDVTTVQAKRKELGLTRKEKPKREYRISDLDGNLIKQGTSQECADAAGVTVATVHQILKRGPRTAKFVVEVIG